MILYELRGSKRRLSNQVRLVPKADLEGLVFGYRSLYGYDPETVELIRERNGTWGLAGQSVYSDDLLVDFDDQYEAAYEMEKTLSAYTYSMWNSGGRSIHFHIQIEPMYSEAVPYIQKAWMQENYPLADASIYKTSGMYRLPGTYHESNPGKRKTLLSTNKGGLLQIKMPEGIEIPIPNTSFEVNPDNSEMLTRHLDNLLLKDIGNGERNSHTFKIAATCRDLGEPLPYAIALAHTWNRTMCRPPQAVGEVETTVYSAYRGIK